uniref:MYND-type domain-containing protein n=1 Tax=Steinernema glaseri TaxID=37863 RepID=A0A1I8APG1_9BILA
MAVYWHAPVTERKKSAAEAPPPPNGSVPAEAEAPPPESSESSEGTNTDGSATEVVKKEKRARIEESYPKDVQLIGPATFTIEGVTHYMPRFRFVQGDPDSDRMTKEELSDMSMAMTNVGARELDRPPVFKRINFGYRRCSKEERATPPVSKDGRRYCGDCGSEVRPQACGRYEHRWRCVGKQHRKWFDVVKPGEVERLKPSLASSRAKQAKEARLKSLNRPGDAPLERALRQIPYGGQLEEAPQFAPADNIPSQTEVEPEAVHTNLIDQSHPFFETGPIPMFDAGTVPIFHPGAIPMFDVRPPPPVKKYVPTAQGTFSNLAENNHWWQEHEPHTLPPYRQFTGSSTDLAALFHLVGDSMQKVGELHKQDAEKVTTSASLDVLMDSLFASIGPIITTGVSMIPGVKIDARMKSKTWNEALERIPLPPR